MQTNFYDFSYRDSGFFGGGRWCGKKKGPEGYYVFYHEKYYVWEKENKKYDTMKTASLNGKYSKLLMKIKRPADRKMYKRFVEYGYQPYGLRLGKWAPEGYDVYLYPYWYIWKNVKQPENIPEHAYQHVDYIYQYSNLIGSFRCTKSKAYYGDHFEHGMCDSGVNHPYCGIYSKPGHWVYSYPNWYIWKNRKKVEDYRDIDPNTDWPPSE